MDELQEVLAMVQRYFPEATIEQIEPIFAQIKQQAPDITVPEIEKMIKMMIPKIQAKMGGQPDQAPEGLEDKRAALQSLRGN